MIDLSILRQQADQERQALRERLAWLEGRITTLDELIAALQAAQEGHADDPPPADPE